MSFRKNLLIGLLLLIATNGLAQSGSYEIYVAELGGEAVVPATDSTAYGESSLVVPSAEGVFSLLVNYMGLDSAPTSVVLLDAAVDQAGSELLSLPIGEELIGGQFVFWMTAELTTEIAAAVENEELAIQVATENHPTGAIRGNFAFDRVDNDPTSWSGIKSLFR